VPLTVVALAFDAADRRVPFSILATRRTRRASSPGHRSAGPARPLVLHRRAAPLPGTSPRARRGCGCSGRFQDPCRPGSVTRAGAGLRPNRPYRYHLGAGAENEPPLLPVLPARMTRRGYALTFVGKDSGSNPAGSPTVYRTDRESWIMQRWWTEWSKATQV
jgi:hypothetical protein